MIFSPTIVVLSFLTSKIMALNDSNFTSTSVSPLKFPPAILSHQVREPQNLKLILQRLQAEQAAKCEYGKNPLIFDICSNIDTLNLANYHLKLTRLEDLVSYVIRPDVIGLLQTHCKPGQWCFNDESSIIKHPLGKYLMVNHSNVMCLFAGCYKEIEGYINNCVQTQLSKNVLNTVPVFCEAIGKENEYCLEPVLQLFHVKAAILGTNEKDGILINTCQKKLSVDKECRHECRDIALQTNKLEYCCLNTSLVKSFSPLNWITDYSNDVGSQCDLPLTGLCWSDGKYYIGVSPNILVITVVATILLMFIFFLGIHICLNTTRKRSSFTESINYSKLNNDVEEEMNLGRSESDTEFEISGYDSKRIMNQVSQQGLSRFVNQTFLPNAKDLVDL